MKANTHVVLSFSLASLLLFGCGRSTEPQQTEAMRYSQEAADRAQARQAARRQAALATLGQKQEPTNVEAPETKAIATQEAESSNRPSQQEAKELSISQAQQILGERGYNPGTPDGILGKRTREAIEKFQRDNSLPVTGKLDEETKNKIIVQNSEKKSTETKSTAAKTGSAIQLTDKEIEKLDKAIATASSGASKLLVIRSISGGYWIFSTSGIAERNKNKITLKEGAEVTIGEKWGKEASQKDIIESLMSHHKKIGEPYSGPYFVDTIKDPGPEGKTTFIVSGGSGTAKKKLDVEIAEILSLR